MPFVLPSIFEMVLVSWPFVVPGPHGALPGGSTVLTGPRHGFFPHRGAQAVWLAARSVTRAMRSRTAASSGASRRGSSRRWRR